MTAGAGSGKTRVLVERFLELLAEHPDWSIDNVVAVTFTEKAAREMTSRIRREIRARIEQSSEPEVRRRWRLHRSRLESARIGTIHALCASILREHAVEADLDPAFQVIDEIDAAVLIDRAIDETLEDIATSPAERASQITGIEVFSFLSPYQVRAAVRTLFAQADRARSAARLSGLVPSEILALWTAKLDDLQATAADSVVNRESWINDVRVLRQTAALSPFDKREQARLRVVELLDQLDSLLAAPLGEDRLKAAAVLIQIASSAGAKGGSVANWSSRREFETAGQSLQRLRAAVKSERVLELAINESDRASAELTAALVAIVEKARRRFEGLKRDNASLDFDDLETFGERMLATRPEVRERYTSKEGGTIRALMVDEFQDISPVQKRLLWMLAPESDELFLIGDSKQSIYRFRGADVTVFDEVQAEFSAGRAGSGESSMTTGSPRKARQADRPDQPLLPFAVEQVTSGLAPVVIRMADCFRSQKGLVSLFNHVFPRILDSSSSVSYEPMAAARSAHRVAGSAEIHIISNTVDDRLSIDELREAEARLIAARIAEIVSDGPVEVYDEATGAYRKLEFGDIGILFQVSTSFDIYEQALSDCGVPYLTIAGRGFYDRQEITDLTNLLLFLRSPIDSLSLAAVLRSPIFAVSDETLLRLRLARKPLWETVVDTELTGRFERHEALEFARETLINLRGLAGRASAGEIISAALQQTGYLATLMALPHGERRVANVSKFLEQADAARSLTLSEFIERVTELRIREAREGEATVEESGVVRLMTVHKAKGLEFPAVWIADSAHPGFRDASVVALHAEFGLSCDVKSEPEDGGEPPRAASFEAIRLLDARLDNAERRRLLYVAATRARDFLFVSGGLRGKLSGEHWLGEIAAAVGLADSDQQSEINYPGGRITVGWHDAEPLTATDRNAAESSRKCGWDAD